MQGLATAELALAMVAELVPSSVVVKRVRLASATMEQPLAMEQAMSLVAGQSDSVRPHMPDSAIIHTLRVAIATSVATEVALHKVRVQMVEAVVQASLIKDHYSPRNQSGARAHHL